MTQPTRAKAMLLVVLLAMSGSVGAAMPVVDIAAVQQLLREITAWNEQLQGMRLQLTQLQQTRAALTGPRGMDQVLPLTPAARNYLPSDWSGVSELIHGGAAADPALAAAARGQLATNAVLSAADLSRLPQVLQSLLANEREAVAAGQALTRAAYSRSSERFVSLTTLIDRIRATPDAKAIAELQGRIEAEEAMLANESVKLGALAQVTETERAARDLIRRESVIHSHGTFGSRFQPVPPVP